MSALNTEHRTLNTPSARFAVGALCAFLLASAPARAGADDWSVYILNDNCPDYTWGFTEAQTRQAFADIVRAHLDEMNRTDAAPEAGRDRYNMAVTEEARCFLEKYPARADELARRVREGRVFVSPFLCNSLWGFQGVEGFFRTLYPARRLAAQWGVPLTVAHHIEEPSLPWGVATLLPGCGIRWLSLPFYNYDSTFDGLRVPPVFDHEGPDGTRLRVVMDPWLSQRFSYMQGAQALKDPAQLAREWIPHYRELTNCASRPLARCWRRRRSPAATCCPARIRGGSACRVSRRCRTRRAGHCWRRSIPSCCDLIERDLGPLPVRDGCVSVELRPHGFAAVRLLP